MEWDAAHEQRLAEAEARGRSNTHRIDEMQQRQINLEKLVTSVEVLATKQESMAETQDEIKSDMASIKSDVNQLAAKPGKRWDAIVDKIALTIAAAIVAYVLAKVGL